MIYILSSNTCSDYALANTLVTIQGIFQILCIVTPIILILSIILSLVGFMINVDTKNKGKKVAFKAIAAILIFLLPSITNVVMDLLDNTSFSLASCWSLAAKSQGDLGDVVYNNETIPNKTGNSIMGDLSGLKEYANASSSADVASLLKAAKEVTDYVRTHNFTYGDAPINPAIDPSARLTSCDRCVGWALYKIGYTDQPKSHGLVVHKTSMPAWLDRHNFKKITSYSEIQAGDIVFFDYNHNDDPDHVFILGNKKSGSNWERYDCGNSTRIRSVQPSVEPVSKGNFTYAYRLP